MVKQDVGIIIKKFRESQNQLISSFTGKGLQISIIKNVENGRGSLCSFLKYAEALDLEIIIKPKTPQPNEISLVKFQHLKHISCNGRLTICGHCVPKATKVEIVQEVPTNEKGICKRCLVGYTMRQKQKKPTQ